MKKIFGGLLVTILMFGFITPVFAVEGAGTSSTDVEYVVEGSFTWSVPAKITVGSDNQHMGTGIVQITSNNIAEGKKIGIALGSSSNYNNGFNLKKENDNTLYPYVLAVEGNELQGATVAIDGIPWVMLRANPSENASQNLYAYFANENDKPTTAGTYTDTLTFEASVYDAD